MELLHSGDMWICSSGAIFSELKLSQTHPYTPSLLIPKLHFAVDLFEVYYVNPKKVDLFEGGVLSESMEGFSNLNLNSENEKNNKNPQKIVHDL
jgi:hypothetical protein